jgi:hypothetical protein
MADRKFRRKGYFHTRHCPVGSDGERQYGPTSAFSRLEMAHGLLLDAFPAGMVLESGGVTWRVGDDHCIHEVGGSRVWEPRRNGYLREVR